MAPEPPTERRRTGDRQITRITEAFAEVARDVRSLDTTVKEHTEERRKTRTWVMILTVAVSLFTLVELLNLKESYDVREKVEEIVCDDAQDTRTVLRPILERTLPDVVIPEMPKECR